MLVGLTCSICIDRNINDKNIKHYGGLICGFLYLVLFFCIFHKLFPRDEDWIKIPLEQVTEEKFLEMVNRRQQLYASRRASRQQWG